MVTQKNYECVCLNCQPNLCDVKSCSKSAAYQLLHKIESPANDRIEQTINSLKAVTALNLF